MLTTKGNNLFYYTMKSETSNHLYEIDFLLSNGTKINPIEVKSEITESINHWMHFVRNLAAESEKNMLFIQKTINGRMG